MLESRPALFSFAQPPQHEDIEETKGSSNPFLCALSLPDDFLIPVGTDAEQ